MAKKEIPEYIQEALTQLNTLYPFFKQGIDPIDKKELKSKLKYIFELKNELELWVLNNFSVAYNFGTYGLGYTEDDLKEAKKIFKKCKHIQSLGQYNMLFFFFAFASLMNNLKVHLSQLKENAFVRIKKGQQLHEIIIDDEIDPVAELAMQNPEIKYDWSKNPIIEKKITIFKGSKKKPKVDDEKLSEAVKVLSKKLNKVAGAKKGIPDFVDRVAGEVDFWLKKLMPGITTPAIIKNLFQVLELGYINQSYDNIRQIDVHIKRGRNALNL